MPNELTIMAFDYGDARLGVAIGNTLIKIPHPIITIEGESMWAKIDALEPIIKEWMPNLFVLGMPHESNNPQKIQLINTIKNFAKRISKKYNREVIMVNEDFTSMHASSLLNEQNIYARKQHGKLDQLAACSILQTYLSEI
ncbi:MAG: Holliday junction resolvase RuvX [Burkholderiales bacterium]|nr:Holliday junction resolvase RuvX [Burkholderiales bacterium]